jgi:Bacterial dnaA protein helix-turn-helix
LSVEGFYREHYSAVRKRLIGKISKSVMTDIPEEKEEVKVGSSEWWQMEYARREKKRKDLETRKAEAMQRAVENWGAIQFSGNIQIIRDIAKKHGITYADIIGPNRKRKFVMARHEAIHAVKQACPTISLPKLGRMFGGRDHTTILHALQKPCTSLKYNTTSELRERALDGKFLARDNMP